MCAAHMVDFEEVIPRLWNYLDEDYRLPGTGCMAFVGASEERLAPFLERFEDVRVALYQSPETLILGGSEESITALVRLLKDANILAQKLPIPPVHTPLMDHKQEEFVAKEGSPVPLRRPHITVYSPITSTPMPDDAGEYRALIASNMTRPVRFWQTLRRMYDDGARIFIQVGTGTLAGNIRSILPEEDVTTVALDVDYRHPLTQLQHLCGRLLAAGVGLDPVGLFEARRPRRLDLDAPAAESGKPRGAIPLTLYWPPLQTDEAPLRTEPPAPGFIGTASAVSRPEGRDSTLEDPRLRPPLPP
jgi:acyl transferase domain-containing protein